MTTIAFIIIALLITPIAAYAADETEAQRAARIEARVIENPADRQCTGQNKCDPWHNQSGLLPTQNDRLNTGLEPVTIRDHGQIK